MRLHATRKNPAPSALDHEPSACALDSSRSLTFIAPSRLRWSPVVFQREMPSISFSFMPLQSSFPHNKGGSTPTPHLLVTKFSWFSSVQPLTSSLQSLSSLLATHPEIAPVTPFLATLPKTHVLKVLCLPHIQKMTGAPPLWSDQSRHISTPHIGTGLPPLR